MASKSQGIRAALQVILAVVIVGLGYLLYVSITEPYAVVERQKERTRLTRARMEQVRTGMTMYQRRNNRFIKGLDSLQTWLRADSLVQVKGDSLFGEGFNLDSLIYSPRTGKMFEMAVNDTSRVRVYRIKDPDSDDMIGTLEPDITRLNAASWR